MKENLFALYSEKKHMQIKYLLRKYQNNEFKCVFCNHKCKKNMGLNVISEVQYRTSYF